MNGMDILLVEDSSADAYLFKEVVARRKAAPVIHWVVDGHYALDYVFQRRQYQYAERPDMIVLDLNLPRIAGYDVLREIKSNHAYANIPVIILTTSRDPLDHAQCKQLGADICFSKPHALNDYEAMIDKMMDWVRLRGSDTPKEVLH